MKSSKELFRDSLALFKKGFWKILLILVTSFAAVIIFQYAVLPLIAFIGMFLFSLLGKSMIVKVILTILGVIIALAFFIAYYAVMLAFRIAPTLAIAGIASDQKPAFWQTYKTALKKAPSYLWLMFVIAFALIPYWILLIIPAIIMFIYFGYAPFANVLDGKKGMHALAFSHQLIRGRFWTVVKKMLYAVLMLLIPLAVITLLGVLIWVASTHISAGAIIALVTVFVGIPFLIWSLCTGIFSIAFAYVMYVELKRTVSISGTPVTAPVVAPAQETNTATVTTESLAETFASPTASTVANAETVVPKWIKVSVWIGLIINIAFLIGLIVTVSFNKEFRSGFMHGFNEARNEARGLPASDSNETLSEDGLTKVFDNYGITFLYPTAYISIPADENDDAQFAQLVDTSGKKGSLSNITVLGYKLNIDTADKPIEKIVEEFFVPEMETYKKSGQITSYTVTNSTTINGTQIVRGTSIGKSEDGSEDIYSESIFLKDGKNIYMIIGESLATEEALLHSAIETVSNSFETTE